MNDGPSREPAPDPAAIADGTQLEPPEPPPHRLAVPVGLLVAVALVVLDQVTKQIAETVLVPGRFVAWIGPHVGWQLVFNPGGAFGIPAPHWLFLFVTVGVVVLVARVLPNTPTLLGATAYGLLLGGAIGNVLDRLFKAGGEGFGTGYVVDFVAWGTFPRFNAADSAITVGFVLLVFALLQEERRVEAALRAAPVDPPTGAPDAAGETTQRPVGPASAPGAGDVEDGDRGEAVTGEVPAGEAATGEDGEALTGDPDADERSGRGA